MNINAELSVWMHRIQSIIERSFSAVFKVVDGVEDALKTGDGKAINALPFGGRSLRSNCDGMALRPRRGLTLSNHIFL